MVFPCIGFYVDGKHPQAKRGGLTRGVLFYTSLVSSSIRAQSVSVDPANQRFPNVSHLVQLLTQYTSIE